MSPSCQLSIHCSHLSTAVFYQLEHLMTSTIYKSLLLEHEPLYVNLLLFLSSVHCNLNDLGHLLSTTAGPVGHEPSNYLSICLQFSHLFPQS